MSYSRTCRSGSGGWNWEAAGGGGGGGGAKREESSGGVAAAGEGDGKVFGCEEKGR